MTDRAIGNGNGFAMHMTLGQLVVSIVILCASVTFGFAGYELAGARAASTAMQGSVDRLGTSVNDHHLADASRDSSARSDIDAVKERMTRMETMLERISYRVGAEAPPRAQNIGAR